MKKYILSVLLVFASTSTNIYTAAYENDLKGEWVKITLPHSYFYPCENPPCGNRGTNVYSTRFPTAKKEWFKEDDCGGEYRMTSKRWISDKIYNVRGMSFKGLIYKSKLGKRENEFAIFFHERRCYDGGPEYGWVFPENCKEGFFYLCGNCNLEDQQWCQWPGDCQAYGDCTGVANALKNPAKYQYWNVKVRQNGDFLLEIVDPVTWKYHGCTVKKPDWFANLYKKDGYITINAQKGAETTIKPPPYMHIDEVKVWK